MFRPSLRSFFRSEAGIRDGHVLEFRRVLFRSQDLQLIQGEAMARPPASQSRWHLPSLSPLPVCIRPRVDRIDQELVDRSEERRVGEERMSRWWANHSVWLGG